MKRPAFECATHPRARGICHFMMSVGIHAPQCGRSAGGRHCGWPPPRWHCGRNMQAHHERREHGWHWMDGGTCRRRSPSLYWGRPSAVGWAEACLSEHGVTRTANVSSATLTLAGSGRTRKLSVRHSTRGPALPILTEGRRTLSFFCGRPFPDSDSDETRVQACNALYASTHEYDRNLKLGPEQASPPCASRNLIPVI